MAGVQSSGPTPWWQLPEYAGKSPVLTSPAPAGYTYDPVQMRYVPIAGSPSDVLAQRTREQGIQDDTRARLLGMLGASSTSSSGSSSAPSSVANSSPVNFSYVNGVSQSSPESLPQIDRIDLPDTSAAAAAAFARAKDKVGAQTAGSVTALRSALAGRGMLGGGGERRGVTGILTAGQANLGDTAREQAVSDVNRATDFAKMGYEGALTQRAQDVSQRGQTIAANDSAASRALQAATTDYSGRISQRGQDIGASESAANRSLQADLAAKAARSASVNTLLSRLY